MNKKKTIALACLVFIGGYFAGNTNGKQQKVTEILTTMNELNNGLVSLARCMKR